MEVFDCSCSCNLIKQLKKTNDKLAFMRDTCPIFQKDGNLDASSDEELKCSLCLLSCLIEALANEEYWCCNREIIRLVIRRTLVENTISLRELQLEVELLSKK